MSSLPGLPVNDVTFYFFGAKPRRHPSIPPKLPSTLKNKEAVDELQDEMKKSLGQADVQDQLGGMGGFSLKLIGVLHK